MSASVDQSPTTPKRVTKTEEMVAIYEDRIERLERRNDGKRHKVSKRVRKPYSRNGRD